VVVLVTALNFVGASTASAAQSPTATHRGSTRHVHPLARHGARSAATLQASVLGSGKLVYHGGPVLQNGTTTYAVFWQPPGTYMSPAYRTDIASYLSSVQGSSLYSLLGQYYDIRGG